MNKRFWRSLTAILLGLTLIFGSGSYAPFTAALATETGAEEAGGQPAAEQPVAGQPAAEQPAADEGGASAPSGEADKPAAEAKPEKALVYVAGASSKTVKKTGFAGTTIPTLSSLGLKAPAGKEFVTWGTSESGGTLYKAGGKFGSDESKIPSKLYAHWKDKPADNAADSAASTDGAANANGAAPTSGAAAGGTDTATAGNPAAAADGAANANGAAPASGAAANGADAAGAPDAATTGNPASGATTTDGAAAGAPDAATAGNPASGATTTDGALTTDGAAAGNPASGATTTNGALTTDGAAAGAPDAAAAGNPASGATTTDGATATDGAAAGTVTDPATAPSGEIVTDSALSGIDAPAAESSAEITIVYHLGDASKSVTSAAGSTLPAPASLGFTLPEGQVFYYWSSSPTGDAGDAFGEGEAITASTPTSLYALCAEPIGISLLAIAPPPKFSEVRYHLDGSTTAYVSVTNPIDSALAPNDSKLNFQKPQNQFLYWQTAPNSGTRVDVNQLISDLPGTADSSGKTVLDLYGLWQSTTLPTLTISQTASVPYLGRGENVTFTITVANTHATDDAFVRVMDVLDANLTLQGVPSGATVSGQNVVWDLRVNHGSRATLSLTVRVNDNATNDKILHTATVTGEALVTTANAGAMKATLDAPGSSVSGPSTSLRTDVLQVIYHGNGGVTSGNLAEVTDNTGYRNAKANTFVKTAYQFVCWNTDAGGSGTDYAPGAAIPVEKVFADVKTLHLYAKWAAPVLSISKNTAKAAVSPGEALTYTIVVKNTSTTAAASNVVVNDVLPAGLQFNSTSPGAAATSSGGTTTLQWSGLTVPANGSVTLKVNATVPTTALSGQSFLNTANIVSINGITAGNFPGSSNTASVDTTVSTKKVIYHGNGGVIALSGEGDYIASGDAVPVIVPDLSSTFVRAGYQLNGWNTQANGLGVTYFAGNTLTPAGNTLDLYAVWSASTDLTIKKTADKTVAVPGESIVYTITVTNAGSAAASTVTLSEIPDSTLTNNADYVAKSAKPSAGTYNEALASSQWVIPTLNPGASATLQLTYKVKVNAAAGNVVNSASIVSHTAAAGVQMKGSGSSSSVTVAISTAAGSLRVSCQVTGNNASTSHDFTYTLTLKDAAGNTLTGSASFTTSNGTAGAFAMNQPMVFTLRHGQSILLWNLPAGTQYRVEQSNYDGYWPNYAHISGSVRGDSTAAFVNSRNRNTDIPKTGYGDGQQWLLWLTLPLLAGALWLLLDKKRKAAAGK